MNGSDNSNFPTRLSIGEARARLITICGGSPVGSELIDLDAAANRVLAGDVYAAADVPAFMNSAMDGYAVRGIDLPQEAQCDFRLIGSMHAGTQVSIPIAGRECVRITTGAPLPCGADTIVVKESVTVGGNLIGIAPGHKLGENVRPAGEDYRAGELALPRGTRIGAAQQGVLAALGQARVAVTRRLRAALLTTGDELVAPGQALGFGQIHDSNRYSLASLLRQYGAELVYCRHVRDDPDQLRSSLLAAASVADVVLSSGGVSAGEADFLPQLLDQIGTVHLWKVRIKPGMPFLFGAIGSTFLFALPGNPVSGIATFLTLVRPALDALSGCREIGIRPWRARLKSAIRKSPGRTEFQRAKLECDEYGALWVEPFPKQGSGVLRSVAEADTLIVFPEELAELDQGSVVEVLRLAG